jgi:hypothetical protein
MLNNFSNIENLKELGNTKDSDLEARLLNLEEK